MSAFIFYVLLHQNELFTDHVSPDPDLGVRIVSWWIHEYTHYTSELIFLMGFHYRVIKCITTRHHSLISPIRVLYRQPIVKLCDILPLFSTREHELNQGECTVLHCTVLYCTVCCTVLYCTILALLNQGGCTVLHCTALYCTVCCTVLYCTTLALLNQGDCTALRYVLCCTALYCTKLCYVLYCTALLHCTLLY